MKEIEIF